MRRLLFLIVCLFSISAEGQDCKPNTISRVRVIGATCQDTTYANCFRTISGLKAVDDQFTIMSYIVSLDGPGFDLPAEILNTGADLNEAKKLIKYFKPGLFIEFRCIKAKDSNGDIYILQPLAIQLR
jgi:hypothetical protein